MNHCELIVDLKRHLQGPDSIIFTEVGLGSKYMESSIPIPDVFLMKPSYTKPLITIYEVKASQSDFMSDIKTMKWERYLPFCDRFYFALDKCIKWEESLGHQKCGVIIHNNEKWSVKRAAPRNPLREDIDEWVWMSLIFNQHKKGSSSHLDRIEFERALLAKKDIKELSYMANEKLKEMAADISKRERHLIDREKSFAVKESDTRLQVLDSISKDLGLWINKDADILKAFLKRQLTESMSEFTTTAQKKLTALIEKANGKCKSDEAR